MNGNSTSGQQKILKEVPQVGEISREDIEQYAEHIGIKLPDEHYLLWIAQAGLQVSLPPPWCPVEDSRGRIYYYNSVTKEAIWEHPLDSYYKDMVEKEREKIAPKEASAVEKTLIDSGTSLMSSLDDAPPISTFVKPPESKHRSLQRRERRRLFKSRSCPSDLHLASQKQSPPQPSVEELKGQRQRLLLELEKLKKTVERYRRLGEQLKTSSIGEPLQRPSERAKAATGNERSPGSNPRKRASKLQVAELRCKAHLSPPQLRHHVSHADLTRIGDRLRQLRQRHLQLSVRAAEQVSDEALAGSIVAQAAYRSSLNKEFVPLLKSATASLSRRSPRRSSEGGDTLEPGYASTLPCLAKRSSWSQGMPAEGTKTSHQEWMKRLSELRMGVEECRLNHLLIK